MFTVTFLREHSLLRKMLRTEPEAILPSLTIDAGAILDFATDYSVAWLHTELYGTVQSDVLCYGPTAMYCDLGSAPSPPLTT